MGFDFGLACTFAGGFIIGRVAFNILASLGNVFINNWKTLTLTLLWLIITAGTCFLCVNEHFGCHTLVIAFVCYCVVFVMLTDVCVKKDKQEIE